MEIDIVVEPDVTPRELAELGAAAERLGVRAVWASNYFSHWDAFLSLTAVARVTERLLLGVLAVSPFEMHPLKIANAGLTLNELCNGRALIAIGAGEGVTGAIGAEKPARLVLAVREAIEIVQGAAADGLGSGYAGELFAVRFPCRHGWAAAAGPAVYACAMGPQMMRMGARVADGMQLGDMPIERMEEVMENVRAGWRKRGGRPHDFRLGNFFGWHIKGDRDAACREARRELAWRGRHLDEEFIRYFLDEEQCSFVREHFEAFAQAWFDRSGEIRGVPDEIVQPLIHGMTATGDLDDLEAEIDRFRKFGEAGLTEMALRLHDEPMAALELIGTRVIPVLREVAPLE